MVQSSAPTNPDVLGSIFQDLDSLHSPGVQVARDGKFVQSTDQSSTKHVKNRDAQSVRSMDEIKTESNLETRCGDQRWKPEVEEKNLDDEDKKTKTTDSTKHSSGDKQGEKQDSRIETISVKLSSSKSSEENYTGACRKLSNAGEIQNSSLASSTSLKKSSPPLTSPSLKPMLSGFRIPKRSSISEDKPNQTPPSFHGNSSSVNQVRSQNFAVISNFKIPKRKSLSFDGTPTGTSFNTVSSKPVKSVGQMVATRSSSIVKPRDTSLYRLSLDKVVSQSCPKSNATESSRIQFNSVRPLLREHITRQDSRSESTSVPLVTSVTGMTKYHANNVTGVTYKHTASSRTTAPCVTSSSNTAACQTKFAGAAHSHDKTTNISWPLSKTVPIIDQPATEKEQRRSNIEIIRMLNEKQRSIREQMFGDRKCTSVSGDLENAHALRQKGLHVSEKSPKRGIVLPIAVVKPSPHAPNVLRSSSSSVRSNNSENSPVKSIASGIIDAHSGNTEELKKVYSEFDSPTSLGCEISGSSVGHEAGALKRDREAVTGVQSDREQQRKLVRLNNKL